MAEGTQVISNVVIKVSANTTSTKSKIDKLKTSFNSLKDTAKGIKTAFQNNFGAITGLISSVQKMVTRMALRSLVKSLFGGLEEGLKNYIHYSSEAKDSADQFATATNYMKNSLGAALMPVLQQIIPYFVQLVNWIVKGIEAFSMWFAYINGKSTYTKAKNVFTEWTDDSEEATKETKKNIKEIKRSIMGFDEINALSKQATDTTSNATSDDDKSKDYGSMFEEAAIDTETVKKFEEILKWAELIAAALALWKIVSFVSDLASALSNLGALGKLLSIIAGLAMIVIGVKLTFDGFKDWFASNKTDKNALLKGIAGIATTIFGSALIGATLGGAYGLVIGIAAGIAISIYTAWLSWMDATFNETRTVLEVSEQVQKECDEFAKKISDTLDVAIGVSFDTYFEAGRDITSTYGAAKETIDAIYDILEKGDLTAKDIGEINKNLEILKGMGLEDVALKIGSVETGFKLARDEAQKLLDTYEILAYKTFAQNATTQAYFDRNQLYNDLITAKQNEGDVLSKMLGMGADALNAAMEEMYNLDENALYLSVYKATDGRVNLRTNSEWLKNMNDAEKAYTMMYARIAGWRETVGETQETADLWAYSQELLGAMRAVEIVNESIEIADSNIESLSRIAAGTADDVLTAMGTITREHINSVKLFSDGTMTYITDQSGKLLAETVNDATATSQIIQALNPTLTVHIEYVDEYNPTGFYQAQEAFSQIREKYQSLDTSDYTIQNLLLEGKRMKDDGKKLKDWKDYLASAKINCFQKTELFHAWNSFATGGFPEDGLFYANHNELVGKFSNGKTAVANNEQIIAGIRQGVADGMNDANSGQGQGGDWTIQIVTPDGVIKGEEVVTALMRYNQRAGKSVVNIH